MTEGTIYYLEHLLQLFYTQTLTIDKNINTSGHDTEHNVAWILFYEGK